MLPADEYLFPRDLDVTDAGIQRCIFIGSCMSGDYIKSFQRAMPEKEFTHVLYNNVAVLPDNADYASAQVQYVQLPLRYVIGDRVVDFKNFTENYDEVLANSLNQLRLMLEGAMKYNVDHALFTVVQNFIVPQAELVAGLDGYGSDRDLRGLVRKLNEELVTIVRGYQNAVVLDVENIASVIGKRYFLNDFIMFSTHNAAWYADWHTFEGGRIEDIGSIEDISPSHFEEFNMTVWRGIEYHYRVARQIDQVKMVVFDLDDTLWRGIIGEHYGEEPYPSSIGWPHGMQEAVNYLRARGILTAICSKNSPELVLERWNRPVDLGFVKLENFALTEIGWTPKVEGMSRLLQAASLTPKSVVFIDDNPVERDAMKMAFPEMRVIAHHPYKTRRLLLNSPATQVAHLTSETINREAMIKKQQDREKARTSMSREDFLASLGCTVTIGKIESPADPHFKRSFELLNKTNQFNTTGRRWSTEEISGFLRAGGEIYHFTVADRFTSYGLVGVVLFRDDNFFQYVMSCRVLGLDIEASVANLIMQQYPHVKTFKANMVETKENMPCRDLYTRLGFEMTDGKEYSLPNDKIGSIAKHLIITTEWPDVRTKVAIEQLKELA